MAEFHASATGVGGREGRVFSGTGAFDLPVHLPGVEREGTTPEELIAAAWAACYGSAFHFIASQAGVDAGEARFHTSVTLDQNLDDAVFTIVRAVLKVEAPSLPDDRLDEIAARAHAICPVSKLLVGGAGDVTVTRHGR